MTLDLSKFKQSFVRDSQDDLAAIANMKQVRRIGEGSHEVVVNKIFEKDGQNLKPIDKLGGAIGFSIVVENAEQAEQIIFLSIPLAVTFRQASNDKENGFQFRNTAQNLMSMGINPDFLRAAIIETNGDAIDSLVGVQFSIQNSWPDKKLHLEYDSGSKGYYFVTSMGDRFADGELSLPIHINNDLKGDDRFAEAVAIAHENNYKLALQMYTVVKPHPTANNDHINEALNKIASPAKKQSGFVASAPKVLNKTPPAFENIYKKSTLPATE